MDVAGEGEGEGGGGFGWAVMRGRHQGPSYDLLISSRAASTAAWVMRSASCAEGGAAGGSDPRLGSVVGKGVVGGGAETSRRSFFLEVLGGASPSASALFAFVVAAKSLERTWASSMDRGRSSRITDLSSFCQRMLEGGNEEKAISAAALLVCLFRAEMYCKTARLTGRRCGVASYLILGNRNKARQAGPGRGEKMGLGGRVSAGWPPLSGTGQNG